MKKSILKKVISGVFVAIVSVTSVTANLLIVAQACGYNEYDDCGMQSVDCGELGYIIDAGLGTPAVYTQRSFSQMFNTYPNNSYFSYTGKECTCHNANTNNCSWERKCDCINYQGAIQCAGFAKMVYYETHNKSIGSFTSYSGSWNKETAKSLFLNTAQGTCLNVNTSSNQNHYITIITTGSNSLTVYHANYGGPCLVKYETYTWENFVKAFPSLKKYVK